MSFAEKIRRSEIEKFDFPGQLPFLRKLQGHKNCIPQVRGIVNKLIDVVKQREAYNTEALEKCKLQILTLKTKYRWLEESKNSKKPDCKKVKPDVDLNGPEEISNCPIVPSTKVHFYVRDLKPKSEDRNKYPIKNNDLCQVLSTPFQHRQEKWYFNNNDKTLPKKLLTNEETKKNEEDMKLSILEDLALTNVSIQESSSSTEKQQDSPKEILSTPNTEYPVDPRLKKVPSIEQRKQYIYDRLKTVKIVKKDQNVNKPIDTAPPCSDDLSPIQKTPVESTEIQIRKEKTKEVNDIIIRSGNVSCIDKTDKTLFHSTTKNTENKPLPSVPETKKSIENNERLKKNSVDQRNERHTKNKEKTVSRALELPSQHCNIIIEEKNEETNNKEKQDIEEEKNIEDPVLCNGEPESVEYSGNTNINGNSVDRNSDTDEQSTDDETVSDDTGLNVQLELSKTQHYRNERKRKAPTRKTAASRRSKRLKQIQLEIKTEFEESNQDTVNQELHEETNKTPTEPVQSTNDPIPTENIIEIPEIKKEVLECDMPIKNIPVTETLEVPSETEIVNTIKEEYDDESNYMDDLDFTEKLEESDLFEESETKPVIDELHEYSNLKELNVVIKEEPIELSDMELEHNRKCVENLSFIDHRISFQYHCKICDFRAIERDLFKHHFSFHPDINWSGFCSICDAHVIGYDANISEEFEHMLKVHVKHNDIIKLDNDKTEETLKPSLKVIRLDGDIFSVKQ